MTFLDSRNRASWLALLQPERVLLGLAVLVPLQGLGASGQAAAPDSPPVPFFQRDIRSADEIYVKGLLDENLLALAAQVGNEAFDNSRAQNHEDQVPLATLLLEINLALWQQVPPAEQGQMVQRVDGIIRQLASTSPQTEREQAAWQKLLVVKEQWDTLCRTAPTDAHIPERAAMTALRENRVPDAMALYEQAGKIALTNGNRPDAFRLQGAAVALDEKSQSRPLSSEAALRLGRRFIELAQTFPEENLAPALYIHGLDLTESLTRNGSLLMVDWLAWRTRFSELFPNEAGQQSQQYKTAVLLILHGQSDDGVRLLNDLLENHPPVVADLIMALSSFAPVLPEADTRQAQACWDLISRFEAEGNAEGNAEGKSGGNAMLSLLTPAQLALTRRCEALALSRLGQGVRAVPLLEELLRTQPRDPVLLRALAESRSTLPDQKSREQAILDWESWSGTQKEGSPAWREAKEKIILLYRENGRTREADQLQKLLDLVW